MLTPSCQRTIDLPLTDAALGERREVVVSKGKDKKKDSKKAKKDKGKKK
jgi:hypothetical protein